MDSKELGFPEVAPVSFVWSLRRRELRCAWHSLSSDSKLPLDVVTKSFPRRNTDAEKVGNRVQPVIHLSAKACVDRDALTLTSEMSLMGCDRCQNFPLT